MTFSGKDLKILVLAKLNRDAQLLHDELASGGLKPCVVKGAAEVLPALSETDMGVLLIAEEVLNVENVALLSGALADQPTWSDLPVLILTTGGSVTKASRQREQERLPLGSVTLLDRPIRKASLLSSVKSALRSRSRQYQIRDTLLERDQADKARREGESRLATAIETAGLGTWELDVDSGTIDGSAIFRANFDFETDEVLTYDKVLARIHPEDSARRQEQLTNAIATQTAYTSEYRVLWRDGRVRWLSVSGRPLSQRIDQSSTGTETFRDPRFAGVTLDITERVLSETALRNADKLALVGRLSSSIAHEINNPLESVTNLLYLLATEDLSPLQKSYVATAQAELARVSEITAQTLRFNRKQAVHEQVVLSEILDSVLALYQGRLLTSGIAVERRYTYKQAILCYPGEIRQIFVNLVANAFDATRRGGKIIVTERLASHPRTGQKGVRVSIADNGSGMTRNVKAHIFEAFHSTKGNNGTGLGLWVSQGIARKHGGSLRFSSSTSAGHCGSVFSLFLPLQ